jgi:hypothetical protein
MWREKREKEREREREKETEGVAMIITSRPKRADGNVLMYRFSFSDIFF